MRRTGVVSNEEDLEPLVRRTLDGDERAWKELWLAIDPVIEEIAGRWRVTSRLSSREDDRRNIVVLVMGRLRADGFKRLALLHEVLLHRDGSARAWLSLVTKRAALNYARGHAESLGGERRWAELLPIHDELSDQLPDSVRVIPAVEARRIQAYAELGLRAPQWKALRLWLTGDDFGEIAGALGLAGAGAAQLLVRSAITHLRRRFSGEDRPGAA